MFITACSQKETPPADDPTPPVETPKPPEQTPSPTPEPTPRADDGLMWLVSPNDLMWSMIIDDVKAMIDEIQSIPSDLQLPSEQRTLLLLEFYHHWYTTPPVHRIPPEPSYLQEHPFDTQVEVDLTGDGKKDKVTVIMEKVGEWEYLLTLQVNDIKLELTLDNNIPYIVSPVEGFAIVDIDTNDNYLEIVISDYGPSNDDFSHIFRFDGKKIIYVGGISGLYSGIEFLGNGELITVQRASILQTWFFSQKYTVSEKHIIEAVTEDLYIPLHIETRYFMLTDLPLYTQRDEDSSTFIIKQTSIVTFTAHDNTEWIQVTLTDGQIGWFKVKDYMTIVTDDEIPAYDVFFMLSFAD